MKVLLLDGDTVQTLSVAFSLKRINAYVTVFCKHRLSYGFWSRYPDKKVLVPHNYDDGDFFDFLLDFLSTDQQDVIIPLYDESLRFLSKNKILLVNHGVKIAVADYQKLILAQNKRALMLFCEENNIPHPETISLHPENLRFAADHIGFPSLIKPDVSSGARGIITVWSYEELIHEFSDAFEKYGPLSLQKYVANSGVYYSAMLYRNYDGIFSETVVVRIKRYFPVKGGTSCYCTTIISREIENICKLALNRLEWIGFADIDLIRDSNTGEIKLLEINPRIPSSIHAACISGVNFPDIITSDLVSGKLPQYQYSPGFNLRYLAMDVLWFIFSSNRFRSKPNWFKFHDRNTYYQDGSLSDPMPFISGMLMGIKKYSSLSYLKSKFRK